MSSGLLFCSSSQQQSQNALQIKYLVLALGDLWYPYFIDGELSPKNRLQRALKLQPTLLRPSLKAHSAYYIKFRMCCENL